MMRAHVERLFAHAFWADELVMGALRDWPEHGGDDEARQGVLRLVSHLLAAERVWLLRLRGEDSSVQPIWPEFALHQVEELSAANRAGYDRLLSELTEADLEREVEYRTSTGAPFRTSVVDILTHVALHGSYHRGQVALAMRQAGWQPVATDYVVHARMTRGLA